MTREEMIAAVDEELRRLDRIRELLARSHSERFTLPESNADGDVSPGAGGGTRKRALSPEARHSIGLAQKRRWARQKRDAAAAPDAK